MLTFVRILACTLFFVTCALSRVVSVEIKTRSSVLGGQQFGLAGSYEAIGGKIHFAVDPSVAVNQIITDINLAPRNASGEVEFSSDFFLIRPADMSRSNGALLIDIPNRGGKTAIRMFNRPGRQFDRNRDWRMLNTKEDYGDGFLLREGFTILAVGWQFDPPHEKSRMRLYTPTAKRDGETIRGVVRADFVVSDRVQHHILSDRNHVPYEVADSTDAVNQLSVRDTVEGVRRVIPRAKWRFARVEKGVPVASSTHVYLEGGFSPAKIYEAVYISKDPPIVGLGPAAVRDVASYFKFNGSTELGIPQRSLSRTLAYGISQCGRFLRTFMYYGFNEDEQGRRALDGVISHVAGGGRGSFNHRFAQPSRDAHPFMNFFHPTDIFPFTDRKQTDPITGRSDGLQVHRLKPNLRPKVFYTNSAYEYWGRAASLIHTSLDGNQDIEPLDNTRIYLFAGSQHGPATFPPPQTTGIQPDNPMDFSWPMRALLTALDRWVDSGVTPPASRYPRIDDGTLVSVDKLNFPVIPGVKISSRIHKAYRADYGPQFYSAGIVTHEPPKIGKAFPVLVPAVDNDGNDRSGIILPELSVPLATYLGWNTFNQRSGPSQEITSMNGSFVQFARTKIERKTTGDPRLSIEERYRDREQYIGKITDAAIDLMDEGYLVPADVPHVIRVAGEHWDTLVDGKRTN